MQDHFPPSGARSRHNPSDVWPTDIHATTFGSPVVGRRVAEAAFATQISTEAWLGAFQSAQDLR